MLIIRVVIYDTYFMFSHRHNIINGIEQITFVALRIAGLVGLEQA